MSKKRANGDGSIYYDTKKGIYRGQISIGYDENGKLKRKAVSGKNATEVKQKIQQIRYNIYAGLFVEPNQITLHMLAKQIIQDKLDFNEINENTYQTHMQTLKRLDPISYIAIQKLNETTIRNYLQTLINYSSSVLHKTYGMLKSTFAEAVKREIIKKNPMDNIKPPKSKQVHEKVRALTIHEQNKLLDVLMHEDVNYSHQMLISMLTGMRMGEVNALSKDDVNLINKSVTIRRTISRGEKGKAYIGKTTKTYAGNRTIYFNDDVAELFRECLALSSIGTDLLFTTASGGLITTSQVNNQFARTITKYDILDSLVYGKVTCHSLRHTFATRMIESGMNAKTLQKTLGHTDISITLNTYADAFEDFMREELTKGTEYLEKMGLSLSQRRPQNNDEILITVTE